MWRALPHVHYRGDREKELLMSPYQYPGGMGCSYEQREKYKLFFSLHEGWVVHESAFIPTS